MEGCPVLKVLPIRKESKVNVAKAESSSNVTKLLFLIWLVKDPVVEPIIKVVYIEDKLYDTIALVYTISYIMIKKSLYLLFSLSSSHDPHLIQYISLLWSHPTVLNGIIEAM